MPERETVTVDGATYVRTDGKWSVVLSHWDHGEYEEPFDTQPLCGVLDALLAERQRREQALELADELLRLIENGEPGHPGEYARRTGWIQERLVKQYRERLEVARHPREEADRD